MNLTDRTPLLIGILAGVTAALLSLGSNAAPLFAILLFAGSALPILIAGLGWGNKASLAAIATAALLTLVLVSPFRALVVLVVTLAPAGWISHLANLARPASELGGPDDAMAWYPLSDILTHLCGVVTVSIIIVGLLIGYNSGMADQTVDMFVQAMNEQNPLFNPDPAVVDAWKVMLRVGLPLMHGVTEVGLLFAAYYIATRIVQASGKALRPREDIPSTLRMHSNAIFIFLGGLALSFTGGTSAVIGTLVCGTFGGGFLLSGFANIHFRTRGESWRLPALWLAYVSVLVTIPAILIVLLGLIDTRRTIAVTPSGKNKPDNNSTL